MKLIVYTQSNNQVAVLIPCTTELTLIEIGEKDIAKVHVFAFEREIECFF